MKIYNLAVDLKKKNYYDSPQLRHNDENKLVLAITDDGEPFDLSGVTTASLAITRLDKQVIVVTGIVEGNTVSFVLGGSELAVNGRCDATVQLYDIDGRISTVDFMIVAVKDPTANGYVPTESENTLITTVLNDGPLRIQEAIDATTAATTAAENAQQVADDNKTTWLNAVDTVALRDSTYPNPQHGDTVRVTSEAKTYRYVSPNGWVVTDIYNATAIDQVTEQLAETNRQTTALSQGIAVVNGATNTLASIEIEGRTLINLLGNQGRIATSATVTVESAKYYVFVKHNQTTNAVTFEKYTGQTSLSLTWASGEYAALYEVESANYVKIGVDWDSVAVGNRYPYVDNVKHLQGVAVTSEGDNLLPPFSEWTLHANAKVISPYELELNATASYQNSRADSINVIGNQTYTVSREGNGRIYVNYLDSAKNQISSINSAALSLTFTTPSNCKFINLTWDNFTANGIHTLKNPMLTLGTVAKPFVPRNPSYLFANVKLGALPDKKDILFEQDGRFKVRKSVEKDGVLDGTLGFTFNRDEAGFKLVNVPRATITGIVSKTVYDLLVTKYNGNILPRYSSLWAADNYFADANTHAISISDTDSGWYEAWTGTQLTADFIKAYFNGWKYTGTADKVTQTWVSVVDGSASPTQTLAYVSTTKAPNYTPYTLSYVLATSQNVDVHDKVEGAVKVNGLTQISVDSGYRRTVVDGKSTWTKGTKPDYTTNPISVKLTYANNVRNSLNDTVNKVEDNTTMLSVHEKAIVDLYVRVKALEVK